jgi:transcriptional regulator with XRE-family HTH domain
MPTKRADFAQTIRSRFLGERMRGLREERGLTLKYVAGYLAVEFSTVARYERAEWPFRRDHVLALLDVYGVYEEAERDKLLALAGNAWRANHWYRDGVEPDKTLGPVPDRWWIQDRAQQICIYSPTIVPDLVQIPAYTDEILAKGQPKPLETHVRAKQVHLAGERGKLLSRRDPKPPELHLILAEPVLRRPVGGKKGLAAQLDRLVELARSNPTVKIQILSDHAAAHPGVHGGFTVYRMGPAFPDVACLDYLDGSLLLEGDAAERFGTAFTMLAREHAEPINDSIAMLNIIKEELA